jgi:hypothetical protein
MRTVLTRRGHHHAVPPLVLFLGLDKLRNSDGVLSVSLLLQSWLRYFGHGYKGISVRA